MRRAHRTTSRDQRGASLILVLAITGFMAVVLSSLLGLTMTGFATGEPVRVDRRVNYALSSALDAAVQQGRAEQTIGRAGFCPGQSLGIDGYVIGITCQPVPQSCLFYERRILYVATEATTSSSASVQVTFRDDFGNTSTDVGVQRFSTTQSVSPPSTVTCSTTPPNTNLPPVARFIHSTVDLTANVNASTSTDDGSISSYAWDFGDGTSGTGVTAAHTYVMPGTYTIELTVTDNLGSKHSFSSDVVVTSPNPPPVASFIVSAVGLTANVNASASTDDGSISSYVWDFGDGTTGTGVTAARAYAASGTYTIQLTVTDNLGSTHRVSRPITVVAPATAVYSWWREAAPARSGNTWSATVKLVIEDQSGTPRPGATATVRIETRRGSTWSTLSSGPVGPMNAAGSVTLTSAGHARTGNNPVEELRFTVTAVSSGGLPWSSSASERVVTILRP